MKSEFLFNGVNDPECLPPVVLDSLAELSKLVPTHLASVGLEDFMPNGKFLSFIGSETRKDERNKRDEESE